MLKRRERARERWRKNLAVNKWRRKLPIAGTSGEVAASESCSADVSRPRLTERTGYNIKSVSMSSMKSAIVQVALIAYGAVMFSGDAKAAQFRASSKNPNEVCGVVLDDLNREPIIPEPAEIFNLVSRSSDLEDLPWHSIDIDVGMDELLRIMDVNNGKFTTREQYFERVMAMWRSTDNITQNRLSIARYDINGDGEEDVVIRMAGLINTETNYDKQRGTSGWRLYARTENDSTDHNFNILWSEGPYFYETFIYKNIFYTLQHDPNRSSLQSGFFDLEVWDWDRSLNPKVKCAYSYF